MGDTITEKISQIHDVFFKILGIRNLTYSPLPSVFREKTFFFFPFEGCWNTKQFLAWRTVTLRGYFYFLHCLYPKDFFAEWGEGLCLWVCAHVCACKNVRMLVGTHAHRHTVNQPVTNLASNFTQYLCNLRFKRVSSLLTVAFWLGVWYLNVSTFLVIRF